MVLIRYRKITDGQKTTTMNLLKKCYFISFLLITGFMYAQNPGDGVPVGAPPLEGEEDMPINNTLVFLTFAALVFAFWWFKKQQASSNI